MNFTISPDGKTIAYVTNTDGFPNIWTISINGGWAKQITIGKNVIRSLKFSPNGKKILFDSDINGDEQFQLYMIDADGGEAKCLTPQHSKGEVYFVKFNKKGDKIYYCTNSKDNRFFESFSLELNTMNETLLYTSEAIHVEQMLDVSNDEKKILLLQYFSNSDQDIILYDLESKQKTNITEHGEIPMKNIGGEFNKKADTVYFISDYEREFLGLAYYKIKSQEIGWHKLAKWDINGFTFSKNEKYLAYSINENGATKIKIYNTKKDKTKTLKLPKGNVVTYHFSPDESKIVLLCDTPQNPNDIFVYDIKKDKMKQITFSMIGGIKKKHFVVPKQIQYKSFDELEINAMLYIPSWMKKDGTNPAMVWPHGGPEHQEKVLFNKYLQILCNRGYIVIAPNFRGSTGYGKTFQQMIYKDWGGAEYKDVLKAYDYLLDSGYVDKKRIAVIGGSFGGFMTLTCVTQSPELWRCAVDIFGPSNLISFLDTVPEYWKPGTITLVGDAVKDKDFLISRSPITHVDKIQCPLCIIQGANDPRVVKAESDQIAERLRAAGKEVEYKVYEDEGHGFSKVNNAIDVWERISSFLDKHMQKSSIN